MGDIELIKRYKSGEVDAFGEIYEKYIDQVYKFVYFKVSSKEIAEDIVSEAFIKCLNALERFEPKFESSLKSWIYTVSYNLVKDYYKSKKEDKRIEDILEIGIHENFGDNLDNKEKLSEVIEFLKRLNEQQREILIMRIWNDLSYKEISEITGQSVGNCKKIVSRVLKNINANLAALLILLII